MSLNIENLETFHENCKIDLYVIEKITNYLYHTLGNITSDIITVTKSFDP